jgi:hypothetical protein
LSACESYVEPLRQVIITHVESKTTKTKQGPFSMFDYFQLMENGDFLNTSCWFEWNVLGTSLVYFTLIVSISVP